MRWLPGLLTLLCLIGSAGTEPARADDIAPAQRQAIIRVLRESLIAEPSILRDALAALQADDTRHHDSVTRDVIAMLGPRLVDSADPVQGNPFGDVTVIEFYDTRCPYCRRMPPVLDSLLRADPRVKLVVKDLPILGPSSQLESRALLAVQRQGGYFKMQAAVMSIGGTSTRDSLRDIADRAGLDGGRMLRDMDDPIIKDRLIANVALSQQLGIDGTPAFVIGSRLIAGAADLAELQRAVADARAR